MDSFSDLIRAWGSPSVFAADHGVDADKVAVWKHRNSIPREYWDRTVQYAGLRGVRGVTFDLLVRFAREAKERRRLDRVQMDARL